MRLLLYFAGTDSASHCPRGTVSLNETECRGMPKAFGGMLHDPFVMNSPTDPKGCFRLAGPHGFFYYNTHASGSGGKERTPYCKRPHISEYVVGSDGAGQCSYGTDPVSEFECRDMSKVFGGTPHEPFLENSASDPKGCFKLDGMHGYYYYNTHFKGSGRIGRTPYCKREYAAQYVVSIDGANKCPKGAVALSESDCRDLPRGFGGTLHKPFVVTSPSDPKGCFRLAGEHGYYYYNIHSAGSGLDGRTPYCKSRAI